MTFALASVLREIVWQRNPLVVKPPRLRAKVDLDVAQRLLVSQLGKGYGEELIQSREVFALVLSIVIGQTAAGTP